jgi:flavin-binding protein dodecin
MSIFAHFLRESRIDVPQRVRLHRLSLETGTNLDIQDLNYQGHRPPRFSLAGNSGEISIGAGTIPSRARVSPNLFRVRHKGEQMFRVIEIDGTSPQGFSEAVRDTIEKLIDSGKQVSYFEVVEQRGAVREGQFKEFQVKMKVAIETPAGKVTEV